MIEELEVIALTEDLPDHNLKAGDVGTVVLVYDVGRGYEVEFMTLDGETVALVALYPHQIRRVGEGEMMHTRPMGAS